VQDWIAAVGAKTAYITPGSPWENGFIEPFNARLCDELLDGEIFYSLAEAKIVIESWRRHYNTARPHGSLGYKPPAPEVFIPAMAARATAQPRPATSPALASKPSVNQHPNWTSQWGLITARKEERQHSQTTQGYAKRRQTH
jgi:putative transposase